MAWQGKGVDYDRLHALLRAVAPQYAPISTRVGGEVGVWKAIDSSGSVWLVEWLEPIEENGKTMQRRRKKLLYNPEQAEREAGLVSSRPRKQKSNLFES